MLKHIALATFAIVLNSCCYCIVQVPPVWEPPMDWELELVEDCDATEVIPLDK